jgi:hypothetical protein
VRIRSLGLYTLKYILSKPFFRAAGLVVFLLLCLSPIDASTPSRDRESHGASYTNYHDPSGPWSIHVVKIDRSVPGTEIRSLHAHDRAVGLETLSDQLKRIRPADGIPIAGLNGDFYQRDRAFAGDPRGLQIVGGELISRPVGGISFWIDSNKQPHMAAVIPRFHIRTTTGLLLPFGLNENPTTNLLQLCTPSFGPSNYTAAARELVLEPPDGWRRLEVGKFYIARVKEIRDRGNGPLNAGTLVLSIPPQLLNNFALVGTETSVGISTKTSPNLQEAKMAISGGPILVKAGKVQKIDPPKIEDYEFTTMLERHPRSAIGWNDQNYFFVEVDGRQKESVGMTLDEFAHYLTRLGCRDAMNLDGGGSATLWFQGAVRNHPCDGFERPIANSLAVVHTNR